MNYLNSYYLQSVQNGQFLFVNNGQIQMTMGIQESGLWAPTNFENQAQSGAVDYFSIISLNNPSSKLSMGAEDMPIPTQQDLLSTVQTGSQESRIELMKAPSRVDTGSVEPGDLFYIFSMNAGRFAGIQNEGGELLLTEEAKYTFRAIPAN